MFTNFTIAFLLAIGIGTWIFSRTSRSTGGNKKSAITVALIVAVVVLIFTKIVLDAVFRNFTGFSF